MMLYHLICVHRAMYIHTSSLCMVNVTLEHWSSFLLIIRQKGRGVGGRERERGVGGREREREEWEGERKVMC